MATPAAAEECPLVVGQVLNGSYRIERLIGQGGMASVFEVSNVRLPRRFALKVITAADARSAEYLLRFRREAEILATLEHPNLVSVSDYNIAPSGQPYLVMELLAGEDLASFLHRSGALPLKVALSIFTQAASALQLVHGRGITHRDLKPANLFLCKNGMVPHYTKVLDFGIAKSDCHSQALITDHLVLMGTPAYMAPEQARCEPGGVDARADQFALALVLYEMLSGKSAFYRRGEPHMSTLCRVLTEDPPPLDDPAMNRAVMRALSKDPGDRYPSLKEMVAEVLSASSIPIEAIELPERTDRVTPGAIDELPEAYTGLRQPPPRPGGEAASVHGRKASPTQGSPRSPQAGRSGEERSVPHSLLTNRQGEIVATPPRPRSRLSLALAGTMLLAGVGGAFGLRYLALAQPGPVATPDLGGTPDLATVLVDLAERPEDLQSPPDLARPKLPPRVRYEPKLSGTLERTALGQSLLRCLRGLNQAELRHRRGEHLQLLRGVDGCLHDSEWHLSGAQSLQLEQCLLDLQKLFSMPSRVDITIIGEE